MASYSVVVRTRDEEDYIERCLRSIREQKNVDKIEILLVDNLSSDSTVERATPYCDAILSIEEFSPGRALNLGVSRAKNEFVVFISGHCIPRTDDWLNQLSIPMLRSTEISSKIVGVYGRQIPEFSSSALDKRDLWNTFRDDDRLQVKDNFFHNANSLIRLETLKENPFDECVTNVEDRVWAKHMIDRGYFLYYAARASVSHWHGINHSADSNRAERVVKVLEDYAINKTAPNDL